MGKRIPQRRKGKGSPTWRAPSHRYAGTIEYKPLNEIELAKGVVTDIIHSTGHDAPLAVIDYEDGTRSLTPAVEGLRVGQDVYTGLKAEAKDGNILPLGSMPEGTIISNVELFPGDGGRFVRSSGGYAYIASKEGDSVVVRLPSGMHKKLHSTCRATVGMAAGGARTEKPFYKAGQSHYKYHARNHKWPISSAVARNPVDHPFGGGAHQHIGKSMTVSRSTPPGRKVGYIAASRTGRRKK